MWSDYRLHRRERVGVKRFGHRHRHHIYGVDADTAGVGLVARFMTWRKRSAAVIRASRLPPSLAERVLVAEDRKQIQPFSDAEAEREAGSDEHAPGAMAGVRISRGEERVDGNSRGVEASLVFLVAHPEVAQSDVPEAGLVLRVDERRAVGSFLRASIGSKAMAEHENYKLQAGQAASCLRYGG